MQTQMQTCRHEARPLPFALHVTGVDKFCAYQWF